MARGRNRGPRSPLGVAATVVLAFGCTPAAWADDGEGAAPADTSAAATEAVLAVESVGIRRSGDVFVLDLTIENLLDTDSAELLDRGVPITVIVDIELWRERNAWFDKFESSRHLVFRLQLDLWDQIYELVTIDRGGRQRRAYPTQEQAQDVVCRQAGVVMGDASLLESGRDYYLVVSAALKPMTLEDVDELESWLSGEIRSGGRSGFGILGLPRQLFGLLMNLTGIRDRNTTMRTTGFRRGDAEAGVVLEAR